MSGKVDTLRERLASVVNAMGYEFVGCELQSSGRHSVLRVYIDNETGVTIANCSKVSHQVSAMLDVEDPIQGKYSLEVSSPGIDRPLFELEHYRKQLGKRVKIHMLVPVGAQHNFVGTLQEVTETHVHLLIDGEEKTLSFADIAKARVCL